MFKSIYNNVTIREALETYQRVNSFRKTAKICGMSKSTIHRWWSTFFLLCTRSKIQRKKYTRRSRKSKYPALEKQVNELFSSKNLKFCSLKDVAKNLDNPPSISWLHRTLKNVKSQEGDLPRQKCAVEVKKSCQVCIKSLAQSIKALVSTRLYVLMKCLFVT
jgi:transposase